MIGTVQRRDTGRPEWVYGRRCKLDQLEHEVRLTDFALLFPDSPIDRRAKVGDTEADGVMIHRGNRCFIEIDNSGKMDARQMASKWKRYRVGEGFDSYILVISLSESRLDRLRRGAEAVRDFALFTTFERLSSGHPEPWVDWYGNRVAL